MARSPGEPVRGSRTGRPIMVLFDVLGQRWTLRILWELSHGNATFRALQTRCGDVSPTLLNKRLKDLRELALVNQGNDGYVLTETGIALTRKLASLDSWANEWAELLKKER